MRTTSTLQPDYSAVRGKRSCINCASRGVAAVISAVRISDVPPRRPPIPPRPCTGARSARRAPAARAPCPACRASRTSSISASTTAACGARPTTAPTGCRCSTSEPTGSIGAIAVAPSDPNVIYVGTGAGIIRPDLATGDGMYKSTDAGKTWTHLGLRDSQMIAHDRRRSRRIPNRLFVAALGHPYGPNPERGIFRSTDGGADVREGALQGRVHERQRRAHRSEQPEHRLRGAVAAAAELHRRRRVRRRAANGIFKSTDGGTTWKQLTDGLPPVIAGEHRDRAEQSEGDLCDGRAASGGRRRRRTGGGRGGAAAAAAASASTSRPTAASTGSSPSNDPSAPAAQARVHDTRPLGRIGGGDLPTITVDPKNENVVYSCSTVFWRTEDGGLTWSAVRGAPGGDDYQKSWVNPNNPEHHPRGRRSGRRGLGQSRRVVEQLVQPADRRDVSRHRPTTPFRIASAAASRTPARRASTAARWTARSRSTTGIR